MCCAWNRFIYTSNVTQKCSLNSQYTYVCVKFVCVLLSLKSRVMTYAGHSSINWIKQLVYTTEQTMYILHLCYYYYQYCMRDRCLLYIQSVKWCVRSALFLAWIVWTFYVWLCCRCRARNDDAITQANRAVARCWCQSILASKWKAYLNFINNNN